MTPNKRIKSDQRQLAFSYKGNAQILEAALGPAGFKHLQHPNRMLEQFRASNKRRGAA